MFSTIAKFKGTHTPMRVLKKMEKGKVMKLLDSISELISNIGLYVKEGSADMTL